MDKQTIDTYNKMAEEYDAETIDFWDRFPRTFLDEFIKNIEKSGSVLDVGSGPGRDGLLLRESGLKVTCLDASVSMVALSSARGLTSVVGDLLNLPFKNDSFDGVWAYTSLLHVSKVDFSKALSEIKRVIKPAGFFALGLIEGDGEVYKESAGVKLPRLFAYYDHDEVESQLSLAGFELLYFESFRPRNSNYLNFLVKRTS